MKVRKKYLGCMFLSACVLLIGFVALPGCNAPEPKRGMASFAPMVEPSAGIARPAEQMTCPVMEGRIDRSIYVRYKGQRVYFCCAGCEERFLSSPETYVSRLPQFDR